MRLVIFVMTLCAWAANAWAETTVIYRKVDSVVAAIFQPPQTLENEMAGVLNSAGFAGSAAGDFATASLPRIPSGHRVVIQPNGVAATEPVPPPEEPIEIPLESFGAGAAGALAAFGGQRLILLARKKKTP